MVSPMLPPRCTRRPSRAITAAHRLVVVVFPLVPVMPTILPRQRSNTSAISLRTGIPSDRASSSSGAFQGTPGDGQTSAAPRTTSGLISAEHDLDTGGQLLGHVAQHTVVAAVDHQHVVPVAGQHTGARQAAASEPDHDSALAHATAPRERAYEDRQQGAGGGSGGEARHQPPFAQAELLEVMMQRAGAEQAPMKAPDGGDVDDDAQGLSHEHDAHERQQPQHVQLRGRGHQRAPQRQGARVAHEDARGEPVEHQERAADHRPARR